MAKSQLVHASKVVRVLIVDDHPVVREGLAMKLRAERDLAVCGEAEDVAEAVAVADTAKPDLAIVDISLKTGNGIDLIKRLKAHDPALRILVWSMYAEGLYAERALRAGALGYVHKGRATREIIEAIRTVLAGKVFLSEEVSGKLLGRLVGAAGIQSERSGIENLSDRELEAFELIGHGLTTPQVAERMHVSPKTVETYRARIKEKLSLASINEVIHRATQWVVENA
jgi:DNA-binding NarL/FixJ family response regulator